MSRRNLASRFFRAAFGFLFAAAGFDQYDLVHATLLPRYLDPFLVMGAAVATAMPILWLVERRPLQSPLGGALESRRWIAGRRQV